MRNDPHARLVMSDISRGSEVEFGIYKAKVDVSQCVSYGIHFSLSSPFSKAEDSRTSPVLGPTRRSKGMSVQLPYSGNERDSNLTNVLGRQRAESDGRMQAVARRTSILYADEPSVRARESPGQLPLHPIRSGPRLLIRPPGKSLSALLRLAELSKRPRSGSL